MAGRCGCSSTTATGASLASGSSCVGVTGAGTTASPAVIDVVVDPAGSNNLQCGVNGLYAAATQVDNANASTTVTGDGSNATPWLVGVQLSVDPDNAITLETDGLFAQTAFVTALDKSIDLAGDGSAATPYTIAANLGTTSRNLLYLDTTVALADQGLVALANPEYTQMNGAFIGGTPPLVGLLKRGGYISGTTSGLGFITITFASFPTGFAYVNLTLASLPSGQIAAEYAVDQATATLSSFQVRVIKPDGNAFVGAIAFCYEVTGW